MRMKVLVLLVTILALGFGKFSEASLTSRHSNHAFTTDYTFQFKTIYSYSQAKIRIGFPIDYLLS